MKIFAYSLLVMCMLSFIVGCSRPLYIPVESVKYRDKNIHHTDTFYRNDSTIIREKGDTVFLEKYKIIFRTKYKDSIVVQQDTIRVPYPVEVEKKQPFKQIVVSWVGRALIILSLLLLLKFLIGKTWKFIKSRFWI